MPAASSRMSRRACGLARDDLADLALAHQRGRARAGRSVGEQELHVAGAHLAAVDAIGRARVALDAARDLDRLGVVEGGGRAAVGIVERRGRPRRLLREGRRPEPAKMTSSIPEPRMLLNDVSPITQRSASTRFDLPQPFGPTTPVSPGSILKSVGIAEALEAGQAQALEFHRDGPSPVPRADYRQSRGRPRSSPRRGVLNRHKGLAAISRSGNQAPEREIPVRNRLISAARRGSWSKSCERRARRSSRRR